MGSSTTANGVESSICHRHGFIMLLLLTLSCKEAGDGWIRQPFFQPQALEALKSTSCDQLGNSSPQPGQAHALFPTVELPTTATKAGELKRSALAQESHSFAPHQKHQGPHMHAPVRAPVLCYLGGITTIGWPRLGLHMRTWASLALGFTSAFGGMGSILLKIRGCSC